MAYPKSPIIIVDTVNDDNSINIGLPKKSDDSEGLTKESGDNGLPRESSEDNSNKIRPKESDNSKGLSESNIYSSISLLIDHPKIPKHIQIRLIKVRHRELQRIVSAKT